MSAAALIGLAVAGVVAGAINTVAGGGSLIGLPLLMILGLPANVANATNRIGVLLQSAAACGQYWRSEVRPGRESLWLIVPTCAGAALGSLLSVDIDEALFRRVIGGVMLVMLAIMLVNPQRWLVSKVPGKGSGADGAGATGAAPRQRSLWLRVVVFFVIGIYGGFLQAGIGVFLLIAMVLFANQDLVSGNALKSLLVTLLTVPSLAVFLWADLVEWGPGLAYALGSALGGVLGARLTVSWGATFVRWVMIVVVTASAVSLLAGH